MPLPSRYAAPESREVMRWVKVTEYRCAWCGQWFRAARAFQRFCCRSHSTLADRRRRELGLPTMREAARAARRAGGGSDGASRGADGEGG